MALYLNGPFNLKLPNTYLFIPFSIIWFIILFCMDNYDTFADIKRDKGIKRDIRGFERIKREYF